MGGGGAKALARHATAALLNASNPAVHYPYTVTQVIFTVRLAYSSGDFETGKNLLAAANEVGCGLGRAL
jgi:hypothetical protein